MDEVPQERLDDAWAEGFAHGYSKGNEEGLKIAFKDGYDFGAKTVSAKFAAEMEKLREALQPFAKVLKGNWSHQSNEMLMSFGFGEDKRLELTLGDFRNASAALKEKE